MKKGYSLFQVIIIIVITSIISGIAVGVIFTRSFASDSGQSYSLLLDDDNVRDFLNVYAELSSEYYENVDKAAMIESAINGMTSYLDESYTTYLSENKAEFLKEQLNGTYEGVGITIKDRTIVSVIKDSPAYKMGVLENDVISSVNDQDVSQMTSNDIAKLIKNSQGAVKIGILRNETALSFNLTVEKLVIPSVSYNMIESTQIAYLKINVFSLTLTEQVEYALAYLQGQSATKLIIDLRDNTGGYLEQAKETASLFLKKDKTIYSLQGKDKTEVYKDKDNNSTEYPIVVLINGQTASAAEILTTALKDSYGATVVGEKSYGKGKVQQTYSLSDGGLVKYTSSKWLRPNGMCIDKIGIIPDFIITNEYEYAPEDVEKTSIIGIKDNQYNKAVELLSV